MVDGLYKNIGAIIQARIGSTRMPGKVNINLPLSGNKTILDHILTRIPDGITPVIATSTKLENDILELKYSNVFRGDEENVLKRFYNCAVENNFEHIIRLTGDNPIIDSNILKSVITKHIESGVSYTSTKGLPLGCNFEIISFQALEESYKFADSDWEKEHVTIYVKNTDALKKQIIEFNDNSSLRLTIDYPSDFALLNIVFDNLGDKFELNDVYSLVKKYPWLANINSSNIQVSK